MRLLLDSLDFQETSTMNPKEFFNDLYHRFLLAPSGSQMRNLCLQAMDLVYTSAYESIGKFSDTGDLLVMLKNTLDRSERDYSASKYDDFLDIFQIIFGGIPFTFSQWKSDWKLK